MEDLKWLVRKWGIPLLILLGVLIYGVCILGQTEQENKKEAEKPASFCVLISLHYCLRMRILSYLCDF